MTTHIPADFIEKYDALLLDSDGTIGRTEDVHAEIGANIMTRNGVPTSFDDRFRMKGWGEARIWDEMAAKGTPIQIERADFINAQTMAFVNRIREINNPKDVRRDGMLELIQAFRNAGKPVIIVSNTPTSAVEALKRATGLTDLIDMTITYDDVARLGLSKKPSPDPYNLAIDRLEKPDGQFLIVEDSETGVLAALAAKGHNDIVQIHYNSLSEVPNAKARYHVKDTGSLLDIFEDTNSKKPEDTPQQRQHPVPDYSGPAYDFKSFG